MPLSRDMGHLEKRLRVVGLRGLPLMLTGGDSPDSPGVFDIFPKWAIHESVHWNLLVVNRGLEFFKVSFRVRLSYSWKQSWNWILQRFSRGAESIFFNWRENNCAVKHQQGLWNTPPHAILPIHHHHNLHSGTNDKRELTGQLSQTLLGRAQGPGPSDDMAQKIKRKIPGLQGISPGPG